MGRPHRKRLLGASPDRAKSVAVVADATGIVATGIVVIGIVVIGIGAVRVAIRARRSRPGARNR